MDSENKFNYSSQNTFKKSKSSNSSGIGKTVFVPFVSGVVGASIVMATCFGVPTIKSKIMGNNNDEYCNKNKNGKACLAVIIMDGWEIKDDYPW